MMRIGAGAKTESQLGFGRRIASDRRGAAAMELALLLPILTLFLCGVFQYGLLMYTYNSMLNTARNGTRTMADGSADVATMTARAKAALPQWIDDEKWTIGATQTPAAGGDEIRVAISVKSNDVTAMHFVPMPERIGTDIMMIKQD